jgi:hypothetical protein
MWQLLNLFRRRRPEIQTTLSSENLATALRRGEKSEAPPRRETLEQLITRKQNELRIKGR